MESQTKSRHQDLHHCSNNPFHILLTTISSDVFFLIFNDLNFPDSMNLRMSCKQLYSIHMINFFDDIPKDILTDEILLSHSHIRKLKLTQNPKVSSIRHLTNLEILEINDVCIDFRGPWGGDNKWINCNISNEELLKLTNLTGLSIRDNGKITNINTLSQLTKLNASGEYALSDEGFNKLINLKYLDVEINPNIKNLNALTRLETLIVSGENGIENNSISNLTNLTTLNLSGNSSITDLNRLSKLKTLILQPMEYYTYMGGYYMGYSSMRNEGISALINLTELNLDNNEFITYINTLTNLQTLSAQSLILNCNLVAKCSLKEDGISKLTNLVNFSGFAE